MTGGTAVILGQTGGNFGAGMTGGMAFVYDPEAVFPMRANPGSIVWQRLESAHWEQQLKTLIEAHVAATDSRWAASILEDWDTARGAFWQVCPKEMLGRLEHPLSEGEPEVVAAE